MSRANPEKALAAILPLAIDCGEGIAVRPMTLGMWAALERIKSPLVTGEDAKDALDLVPSLYLLTHDPREVLRGDLLDAALQWADTVSVDAMARIHKAAARQQLAVFDVIPETKKKTSRGTTAGSPRGSTAPRATSAGATKTSSGTRRRARSR